MQEFIFRRDNKRYLACNMPQYGGDEVGWLSVVAMFYDDVGVLDDSIVTIILQIGVLYILYFLI